MHRARSSLALGALTGVDAVGYVRVSTERQAGEVFTSLHDQQVAIEVLAKRLGVTVGRWYRDEGASGATVAKRPAFRDLLATCQESPRLSQTPGFVLVLNDSRFGRFDDPDEAAALRFELRQFGWVVRFAENDDSADTTTRSVMRAIGSAQASEYRRNLMRNSRRGMRGAASQGFWTREAPFGYRREVVHPADRRRTLEVGVPKAGDEKVRLTPHDAEAEIVRRMFSQYSSGMHTLGTLVRELDQRAPGRAWSRRTVQAILRNVVYLGEVRGGTHAGVIDETGPVESFGKLDAHAPIVSQEMFDSVQSRLTLNRQQTRASRADYLLSGLVRCSDCGRSYTGGGGVHWKFYKDAGGTARVPMCQGPIGTVGRAILDQAVLKLLAKEIAGPSIRTAIERALDEQLGALSNRTLDTSASLARQRQRLERQRDNLVALLADGTLSKAEAGPRLERVRADLARCEASAQQTKFAGRAATVAQSERDRILALARDFPAMAKRLTGPALRELVRPWLADAQFSKRTRRLVVWIHRLPAIGGLHLLRSPAPG